MDDRVSDYQLGTYSQPLEKRDFWCRQSMEEIARQYWYEFSVVGVCILVDLGAA